MAKIQVLQPHIANQIAAGEVVERPASIVKELVENSIDAGATSIVIEIQNGGIDLIRISDNGGGIPAEDTLLAFERHATSKISTQEDLTVIETLGFRGEALCSIAAVAQVELKTLAQGEETGTLIRMEGGVCKLHQAVGATQGTSILVENLFYNVPARRKFLKSVRSEAAAIGEHIAKLILSRPDVAIRYTNNGKSIYQSPGDGELQHAIYCVYGAEVLPHLKQVSLDNGYLNIQGYIGTPEIARPNRKDQILLLNGRVIRSFALGSAIQRAYDTRLMGGKYAFAVLNMQISSREVDVNVHPNKLEVRFAQESRVFSAMLQACSRALGAGSIPDMEFPAEKPYSGATDSRTKDVGQLTDTDSSDDFKPAVFEVLDNQVLQGSIRVKEGTFSIPHFRVDATPLSAANDRPRVLNHSKVVSEPAGEATMLSGLLNDAIARQEQRSFGALPHTVIGQVFQSYWIVQEGEDLYFIDQHAAHERMLYERLMGQAGETAAQMLLTPEVLQLTPSEYAVYTEHESTLQSIGFQFEAFGPSAIRVVEVPAALSRAPIGRILRDALELLRKDRGATTQELRREAIIQAACKHAIKGGDAITRHELEELLTYFKQEGTPLTCPHGRPVLFRLSRKELEKMFKRIV